NATVEMTTANVQQPAGDTLLFALPVDVNVYQDIQNYYVGPTGNEGRVLKFQPEYLVTAQDFTKGDVNVGLCTVSSAGGNTYVTTTPILNGAAVALCQRVSARLAKHKNKKEQTCQEIIDFLGS
ncbi:MAG: hypothetical protein II687_00915, partial [Selenomonadaceae bacterium]|nr:hypothetical protein [Selenomonadaceae bacterium]